MVYELTGICYASKLLKLMRQAAFTGQLKGGQGDSPAAHIPARGRPNDEGGFTMTELLVTMILLAITLAGLAGLQINAVRRVTEAKRGTEALRLAESVLARYEEKGCQFSDLPVQPGTQRWELVQNP